MELAFITMQNHIKYEGATVYLNKSDVYMSNYDFTESYSTKLKSHIKIHSLHFRSLRT